MSPEQPRAIEPLMGWTSSGDMKTAAQHSLRHKEEAVAYCEREGIPYQVIEPKVPARRPAAYATILRSGAANLDPLDLRAGRGIPRGDKFWVA